VVLKAINRASLVPVQPGAVGTEGNEVSKRSISVIPNDEDEETGQEPSHFGSADQVLLMSQLSVGPTRYRDVVLTSWDRGMSNGE
jgi:hypothetical protein